MKATLRNENVNISVTFKHLGNKSWDAMPSNYNNHKVTVINNNTKKQTTFEYWCSITEGTFQYENDLLMAVYNFINDSIGYENAQYNGNGFENFCNEFGYESEDYDNYSQLTVDGIKKMYINKEALEIYKACKRALKSSERVFGDIDTICRVHEEIGRATGEF